MAKHFASTFIERVAAGEVPGFSIADDSPLLRFETMDIYAKPGTRVVFMGENGTDWDKEHSQKHLVIGQTYTVQRMDVGDWSSRVYLREVPDEGFNTVHFAEAPAATTREQAGDRG